MCLTHQMFNSNVSSTFICLVDAALISDLSTEKSNLYGACHTDWLTLYDGDDTAASRLGGGNFCGDIAPTTTYTTSRNTITLYFHSDDNIEYVGFDVILTRFYTGVCQAGEFSCGNGRCIDASLQCNGNNPCGDHSDCFPGSTTSRYDIHRDSNEVEVCYPDPCNTNDETGSGESAVFIALGSAAFFVIILITLVVVKLSRRQMAMRKTTSVATTSATVASQTPQELHVTAAPQNAPLQTVTSYQPPPYMTSYPSPPLYSS